MESYLTDRFYQVKFRGTTSKLFQATSGVPQGSHLGPLLFILALNDVGTVIRHSNVLIYADDMKIFKKIDDLTDCALLQSDIKEFDRWCSKKNLYLNAEKCQSKIVFEYSIDNTVLCDVDSVRDLGVSFDTNLTFNRHIDLICTKASSLFGFIKIWAKEFNNPLVTKTLFTTIVRPHLEYASQVWSPYYRVHIDRIEKIQKRFVRFALNHLNWSDPFALPP